MRYELRKKRTKAQFAVHRSVDYVFKSHNIFNAFFGKERGVIQKVVCGDDVLYSGIQIVLIYGSNLWSYTELGKIQGVAMIELKSILTEMNTIAV